MTISWIHLLNRQYTSLSKSLLVGSSFCSDSSGLEGTGSVISLCYRVNTFRWLLTCHCSVLKYLEVPPEVHPFASLSQVVQIKNQISVSLFSFLSVVRFLPHPLVCSFLFPSLLTYTSLFQGIVQEAKSPFFLAQVEQNILLIQPVSHPLSFPECILCFIFMRLTSAKWPFPHNLKNFCFKKFLKSFCHLIYSLSCPTSFVHILLLESIFWKMSFYPKITIWLYQLTTQAKFFEHLTF